MKKSGILILIWIFSLLFSLSVKAESVTVTLEPEEASIMRGDRIKLRMKLTSMERFQKMDAFLLYDETMVRYISSEDGILGENGKIKINLEKIFMDGFVEEYEDEYTTQEENPEAEETKKVIYIIFKAIKSGKTKFSFAPGLKIYSEKEEKMSVSHNSLELVIKEPREASHISTLSDIQLDGFELSPSFSRNIFQYSVKVPREVRKLPLSALPSDDKARIVVAGNDYFQIGDNLVKLIVTAENGAQSTYEIIVTREEKETAPVLPETKSEAKEVVKPKEIKKEEAGKEDLGEEVREGEGVPNEEGKAEKTKNNLDDRKEQLFYGIMGVVAILALIILGVILNRLKKIEEKEVKK